jgi:hypothetical protein
MANNTLSRTKCGGFKKISVVYILELEFSAARGYNAIANNCSGKGR